MRTRPFRWLFTAVLALELMVAFSRDAVILGASASWTNDGYRFEGGTTPWGLGLAVVIASLYVLLMDTTVVDSGKPLQCVLRRFMAFWLDFILGLSVLGPVIGLPPMVIEWKRTGVFAWAFVRTTQVASDVPLMILLAPLTVGAILLWHAVPFSRRRPSPGACIMGYQVLPEGGGPLTLRRALLRTLLGFIAVGGAYLAPFIGRDRKQGNFWLDKVCGTRATLLE